MTRVRPKRQRHVGFEALEGRLALSTGMAVAPPHATALVALAQRLIPASIKSQVSIINGSTVQVTSLNGKLGKSRFTGSGGGILVGSQFQGGDIFLSNAKGSIHLSLGPAPVIQVGQKLKLTVAIIALESTGKYNLVTGSSGSLNVTIPPAPKPASISGGFGTYSVSAGAQLR